MTYKPQPEILETPMAEFGVGLTQKINAVAEYYGGYEWGDGDVINWEMVAINMALRYEPGFQVGPPKKKRGSQPKPKTAARDFYIAYMMTKELERHAIKDEIAAAVAVHAEYPSLGANGEAVRQRWMTLKRDDGTFKRMKEYAARAHDYHG